MPTAIKFENISKQYRLGLVSTRTLTHDLNRWWQMNILRREDPYLQIGEVNDRAHKGNSEYVWALKDINFEVEQGDVVGIIGKNGAGKSTLLKILSKVTAPTTGSIKAKGRIASLLEVGTGFHPEMTGRENIYMNGAIMGMRKSEIDRKFDEIVDFAGVERYIDTPVKRYSSGMTVRLGFAVAAFLEPEILVVDEVLAVGDAEFQKKAIGKMQDVSRGDGRTVLFVSHNLTAIKSLCNSTLLFENGCLAHSGNTSEIINIYLKRDYSNNNFNNGKFNLINHPNKKNKFGIINAELFCGGIEKNIIETGEPLEIRVTICKNSHFINPEFGIVLMDDEIRYIGINNNHIGIQFNSINKNEIQVAFRIDRFKIFGNKEILVNLYFGDDDIEYECIYNAFSFYTNINDVYASGRLLDKDFNIMYDPDFSIKILQ
ncbi:MAG: polysaccharide ABC transporter ATP-binding protein [Bacteroidota bacterium]|nr:polysaccharide ABC transporter ATP-binding protein [Bacteroidota bacterium]